MLINFICFSYYEMRCSFLVGSINQPMKMLRHIIFFFSFILMIYGEWFFLGSGSVCVDHYCQRINQSNLIAWLRKFIYHAFSSPFSSISCNHYSLDCCLQLCPPVDLFNYSSPGFVSLVYFLFCFVFGLFVLLFFFNSYVFTYGNHQHQVRQPPAPLLPPGWLPNPTSWPNDA